MKKEAIREYLNKTPKADLEDVMFVFPEVTLKEAARAVQRQKISKALWQWLPRLLTAGVFARWQEDGRQGT